MDIRNIGFASGISVAPREGAPGARGADIFLKAYEKGVAVRPNGDTIALAPILTSSEKEIDAMVDAVRSAVRAIN